MTDIPDHLLPHVLAVMMTTATRNVAFARELLLTALTSKFLHVPKHQAMIATTEKEVAEAEMHASFYPTLLFAIGLEGLTKTDVMESIKTVPPALKLYESIAAEINKARPLEHTR